MLGGERELDVELFEGSQEVVGVIAEVVLAFGETDLVDSLGASLLQGLLVPGTNLVVTSESATKQTRSDPGFRVLQGRKEEAAEKE